MTYAEIAKLTGADVAARAVAGELSPAQVWTGFKGAAVYTRALASGDIAPGYTASDRLQRCLSCPHATRGGEHRLAAGISQAIYCGPMLLDRLEEADPTCGCLVAVTVGGEFIPAGKTLVQSCRCPQGKW